MIRLQILIPIECHIYFSLTHYSQGLASKNFLYEMDTCLNVELNFCTYYFRKNIFYLHQRKELFFLFSYFRKYWTNNTKIHANARNKIEGGLKWSQVPGKSEFHSDRGKPGNRVESLIQLWITHSL